MALTCPTCAQPIPSSAIVEGIDAARCPKCAALVDLRAKTGAFPRSAAIAAPIPANWTVEEGPSGFSARFRWLKWPVFAMLPFTVLWNSVLGLMAYGISDHGEHLERLLLMILVPHVWVGVAFLYWTLAQILNSTQVTATAGAVSVTIGPLPWRHKKIDLTAIDIQQIFVTERHQKNSTLWDVCAVMRDGKNRVLIQSLRSQAEAVFLESRLEKMLSIEDRPVEGEARRLPMQQMT